MKKFIIPLILLIIILSGCKNGLGIEKSVYKDGVEVVNIIDHSFETEKKISDEDKEKIDNFFKDNPYSKDAKFETKDEEFSFWVDALNITYTSYNLAYDEYDFKEMDKIEEDYNFVLDKLQKEYKVELKD